MREEDNSTLREVVNQIRAFANRQGISVLDADRSGQMVKRIMKQFALSRRAKSREGAQEEDIPDYGVIDVDPRVIQCRFIAEINSATLDMPSLYEKSEALVRTVLSALKKVGESRIYLYFTQALKQQIAQRYGIDLNEIPPGQYLLMRQFAQWKAEASNQDERRSKMFAAIKEVQKATPSGVEEVSKILCSTLLKELRANNENDSMQLQRKFMYYIHDRALLPADYVIPITASTALSSTALTDVHCNGSSQMPNTVFYSVSVKVKNHDITITDRVVDRNDVEVTVSRDWLANLMRFVNQAS